MVALLDSGLNTAHVATRDGVTELIDLPASRIEWNRELCAISRPTVTIDAAECDAVLDDVHPWAHTLVINRNGRRVWEGPLRRRVDGTSLTLTASDVVGYTERRPIRTARAVTASGTVTEMQWALDQALTTDDPGVTVTALSGPGPLTDVEVAPGEKYAADLLADQVAAGGRWTALGRTVFLWDSATLPGALREMSTEEHLQATIEVIEDGDLLATEVWARNDDGVAAVAVAAGGQVDPFYGHVAVLAPSPAPKQPGVAATAAAVIARSYPTPVVLSIPPDARVLPTAPFPIDLLVPGVAVPVITTAPTGRSVRGTFILQSVKVTQERGAPEQVTITLSTGVQEA